VKALRQALPGLADEGFAEVHVLSADAVDSVRILRGEPRSASGRAASKA
jgi:hypothetical protein